jgi:hypothetical protein
MLGTLAPLPLPLSGGNGLLHVLELKTFQALRTWCTQLAASMASLQLWGPSFGFGSAAAFAAHTVVQPTYFYVNHEK